MSEPLNWALKEWAVVCDRLAGGQQIVLLRKGGIAESGGEFELEHNRFALFPTYLHQNRQMLKPEFAESLASPTAEPATIEISAFAEVSKIVQLTGRGQMDRLREFHCWSEALIDMRFSYRPSNPLYLMIVRAYSIPPLSIANSVEYAGCKSWVPLTSAIAAAGAYAVIDDESFARRRDEILARLAD